MAVVTGGRRPCAPFLQPAPRRGEAARGPPRPPRLPSPRPAPRCSGTWRRRCPIAPRRCGYGRPVLGLRRPPGCQQPRGLPARPPRPRCHGNRAGPRAPDVAGAPRGGPTVSVFGEPRRVNRLRAQSVGRRSGRSWNSPAAAEAAMRTCALVTRAGY